MAIFNSYVSLPEGTQDDINWHHVPSSHPKPSHDSTCPKPQHSRKASRLPRLGDPAVPSNSSFVAFLWEKRSVSCGKAGWFEMFPSLCKVDRGCAAAWQVGLRGGYKPSSRSLLAGEQSDTLGLLRLNDRKSRHRRIKKQRRYERLAATSQLSLW